MNAKVAKSATKTTRHSVSAAFAVFAFYVALVLCQHRHTARRRRTRAQKHGAGQRARQTCRREAASPRRAGGAGRRWSAAVRTWVVWGPGPAGRAPAQIT